MLNRLKAALIEAFQLGDASAGVMPQDDVSLASAALMVEVIACDYEDRPQERDTLLAIVQRSFGLNCVFRRR